MTDEDDNQHEVPLEIPPAKQADYSYTLRVLRLCPAHLTRQTYDDFLQGNDNPDLYGGATIYLSDEENQLLLDITLVDLDFHEVPKSEYRTLIEYAQFHGYNAIDFQYENPQHPMLPYFPAQFSDLLL